MTIKNKLYIVATPIGNMQDISFRAIDILKQVKLIITENTQHTRNLLKNFNITTYVSSFNKFNENKLTTKIFNKLKYINIALVSDAGTPNINDPGYKLIKLCHQNNITVTPIPGPCALISAISASGLPSHEFYYKGFFPRKKTHQIQTLKKIKYKNITTIFYESCHRIINSIKTIIEILGEKKIIVLAKEITKKWEKIKYDTAKNILLWLEKDIKRQKGEIVILIKGIKIKKQTIPIHVRNVLSILITKLSKKTAIQITSKICQIKKNILYKYLIKNKIKCDIIKQVNQDSR